MTYLSGIYLLLIYFKILFGAILRRRLNLVIIVIVVDRYEAI